MSFLKTISKAILKTVGAAEFAKDESGKPILTAEQRAVAVEKFGEGAIAAFEQALAGDDDDAQKGVNFLMALKEAHDLDAKDLNDRLTAAMAAQKSAEAERDRLAKLPEPHPAPTGAASVPALAIMVDMKALHNVQVAAMLKEGRIYGAADTPTLDVAELNKEFSMAMPPKQRIDILTKEIYLGFPDHVHMTMVQSDTDYIASAALIDSVVQEFTDVWTPKGQAKFTPIRIPYRRHKINVRIKPTQILKSWLLYLYQQNTTFAQMPITKYIVEQHILPKIQDDLTRKMVGKGKYEAAPAGQNDGDAGRDAAQAMDGFETIICEDLKTGKAKMNFFKGAVNLFGLEGKEFLDAFHAYVDGISKYFVGNLPIFCSEQMVLHYQRQDFAVNGKYTGQTIGNSVRFTKFTLVPLLSMYNSPMLFATPKENFVELVDINKAPNIIQKIEEHHYDVDIIGEFSLSVGFRIGEALYVYVPADYDPTKAIIADSSDIVAEGSVWTHGGSAGTETTDPDPDAGGDEETA